MKVIFRKFKQGNDIIAFFPEQYGFPNCNKYMMMSYMHIGQHGEADYEGCVMVSKLAKPEEYADLLSELKRIYHDETITVVKRFQRN